MSKPSTDKEPNDINYSPSIKVDPTLSAKGVKSINPNIQVDCQGIMLEGSQTW